MTERIELYKSDAISNKSEDALGRNPFIDAVANFIKSQATEVNKDGKKELRNLGDPLTIGIYGKWGYGKTSVIRCIETEIKNSFFTAYYNPWMYNNEEDLVKHLFETIISSINLKEDIESRKKLTDKLKNYFINFLKGFKVKAKLGIPFTDNSVDATFDPKPLLESIEKEINTEQQETIYDAKDQINEVLKSLSNPIVIFIDDIDRLSKAEIYTLFKTVRLIADFKNIIYVLSFDDEMVAKSIKDNFVGGNDSDGFNYLDKIIDIPLRLPNYSKSNIKNYLSNKIEFKNSVPFFDDLLDFIISEVINTPRQCLRVINSVSFLKPSLKHISIEYLFVLESIRLNRQEIFYFIDYYYRQVVVNCQYDYFIKINKVSMLNELLNEDENFEKVKDIIELWWGFFKKLFFIDISHALQILKIDSQGKMVYTDYLLSSANLNRVENELTPSILNDYMSFIKKI